ncbi:MAG: hypothetical protein ACE5HI_10325, partial [bacterium]
DFGNLVNSFSSNKFNWFKELSMGVDIWRQEFQLALIQGDSTFLEGSGNPYTGIRLSFDYTLNYQQSIQGYTFFKYSRDYLSGEAELSFVNPLGNHSLWKLENHFEGNSFYRDDNLKYFQNISSLAFKLREFGPFTLDLEDEFLLRRYDNESNTYPNYLNNSFNGLAKLDLGIGSYIGASYRNVQRIHSNYDVNDYQENRFELSWFQAVSRNMSFSFENELRFRNYTNVPVDTTFQDYWEDYFRGDLRIPFHSFLGTEIQGSITKRDYDFFSVKSLPDYVQWEIEPELYFNLGSDWRISAGFYYSEQIHQKFVNRVPVASVDAAVSIPFEDYFSYGPTLTIEFFQIDGIMLNLRESFLLQRYPNFQTRNVQSFNLYSDRNINSILLFFSWNISHRWRCSVLANMDDDRSRKVESSDSQNTLVGLEVNYLF